MLKPLLAEKAETINFPVLGSFKLDGIRVLCKEGQSLSRSLKQIPNQHFASMMDHPMFHGLDGEACVGPANAQDVMQKTTSGLMSQDGTPDFVFWVFDYWTKPDTPYHERYANLVMGFTGPNKSFPGYPYIRLLEHKLIQNQQELDAFESEALTQGYEGVMVRSLNGPYKYGRSTAKQGILLKVKRFIDKEAVIVGKKEKMHNANELETDELGYAKRSSQKSGLVPMGTLGALDCVDISTGQPFSIGTGFDDALRDKLWEADILGEIVKYKSFPTGVKEKPRFPVFLGIRDPSDCDEYVLMAAERLYNQFAVALEEKRLCMPPVRKALLESHERDTEYDDHVNVWNIAAKLRETFNHDVKVPSPRTNTTNKELVDDIKYYLELCPLLAELVRRFEQACETCDAFADDLDGDFDQPESDVYTTKK